MAKELNRMETAYNRMAKTYNRMTNACNRMANACNKMTNACNRFERHIEKELKRNVIEWQKFQQNGKDWRTANSLGDDLHATFSACLL
ncbi:hypothetical protein CEXT_228591 [Caerostris extrusa]|uniref:Uncharacterized protein n=1 Tax=Caerostris extrusa TaxID=172846 RepID=A0AAV4NBF3_CAEEX|nr:hypothetical protein CEXT_228591 [Caerostris extrusa]